MSEKRKDNKGRILRTGESQRKDLSYMYRYKNICGERKYIYAKSLDELRKTEREINNDLEAGIDTNGGELTLNQQFDKYLCVNKNLADSTRSNYIYMWDRFIKNSRLGNMKICDIRKSDILQFYGKMSGNGLANGTIQIFHKMIHPSLELAVDDDCIRKNPSSKCLNNFNGGAKKREALTIKQQEQFIDFVKSSKVYQKHFILFTIMLETGCRIGEIAGLTWKDVDLTSREISINHQLTYKYINGKTEFRVSKPKSESGNRLIPLTQYAKQLLLEQKKICLKFYGCQDIAIDGFSNFVFRNIKGGPLYSPNVNKVLYKIIDIYNLSANKKEMLPKISAHILRHTACTRMREKGIDPKIVQYIMGHADIKMTMDVYESVDKVRLKKEMEKAEEKTA